MQLESQQMTTDTPSLGPCCRCGKTLDVVNVMMLNRRAPIAGTGWGCVVCGLAADGAVAVLCNDCVGHPPVFVCAGYPSAGARALHDDLDPEPFDHDANVEH